MHKWLGSAYRNRATIVTKGRYRHVVIQNGGDSLCQVTVDDTGFTSNDLVLHTKACV
jgi:hypothetical protein